MMILTWTQHNYPLQTQQLQPLLKPQKPEGIPVLLTKLHLKPMSTLFQVQPSFALIMYGIAPYFKKRRLTLRSGWSCSREKRRALGSAHAGTK